MLCCIFPPKVHEFNEEYTVEKPIKPKREPSTHDSCKSVNGSYDSSRSSIEYKEELLEKRNELIRTTTRNSLKMNEYIQDDNLMMLDQQQQLECYRMYRQIRDKNKKVEYLQELIKNSNNDDDIIDEFEELLNLYTEVNDLYNEMFFKYDAMKQ